MKIPYLENYKQIIDDNVLLMHAYGQDTQPDYKISSDMLTYMEVETDMFQLNKYGVIPNMDVNFYFDSKDFACALAYKLGQLKEYKIKETRVQMEVPEVISDYIDYYDSNSDGCITITSIIEDNTISGGNLVIGLSSTNISSGEVTTSSLTFENHDEFHKANLTNERYYLSSDIFPYCIGYGVPEYYESDILSGKFSVKIGPYEVGKKYTVLCHPYEHGDVAVKLPVNDTIYKSFNHIIDSKEFVDTMLFLTYEVKKIKTHGGYRFILDGHLHGAVLFRDLNKIGKYLEMIHPDVGDIVTIDFPDENNRMQFEITDCNDKNLGNDGVNPLLHRYIWKCKARRYINSGEDFPEKNEANERWEEKIDFLDNTDEMVAKEISRYDEDNSDAVYGGYERKIKPHDKRKVDTKKESSKFDFIEDGNSIELLAFHDGSRLITDGYELFFVDTKENCYKITMAEDEHIIDENLVASGIQYLKSTDNALFFVNFDNRSQRICEDGSITQGEVEYCLNSLLDTTYDTEDNNDTGNCFYKFRESNTVLMSLNDHLYCRFGNGSRKVVKIV